MIELCGGGDLLNYVRKRRSLKEDMAKFFFKQIIEGLQYMHEKHIIHRDIKLDNILLDGDGYIKIGDFGVSKLTKPGEIIMDQCGTPAYIAPEILLDEGYLGSGVDIWSSGVVLYSMLYGTVPFKGNSMPELHRLIIDGKFEMKDDISADARDLIKKILTLDPVSRLNSQEILDHRWMKDVKDQMEIFTDLEKDKIEREFTCYDFNHLNRNTNLPPTGPQF